MASVMEGRGYDPMTFQKKPSVFGVSPAHQRRVCLPISWANERPGCNVASCNQVYSGFIPDTIIHIEFSKTKESVYIFVRSIWDFCENLCHLRLLFKIKSFWNALMCPQLRAVDVIWYKYCLNIQTERCLRISLNRILLDKAADLTKSKLGQAA